MSALLGRQYTEVQISFSVWNSVLSLGGWGITVDWSPTQIVLVQVGVSKMISRSEIGQVGCVTSPCLQQRYRANERAAVWRHRSCAEKTPPPLIVTQRVFGRQLFSGRLPSNAK
jgi:hypothetical protein